MTWCPHVTVATIVEKDQRYLLVHELSDGQWVYNQPAGHLDPDESLSQAAIRETLEETAWEIELTGFLGLCLYKSPHNQVTYMRNTFIGRPLLHYPNRSLDAGIQSAVWLTYDEVVQRRTLLRSPLVLHDIERYRAGHSFPLDLVYDHR